MPKRILFKEEIVSEKNKSCIWAARHSYRRDHYKMRLFDAKKKSVGWLPLTPQLPLLELRTENTANESAF